MHLYESNDIVEQTALSLPNAVKDTIALDTSAFATAEIQAFNAQKNITSYVELITAQDIAYMSDKVAYYKTYWSELGVTVKDFSVDYSFEDVTIRGDSARAHVYEGVSFTYTWLTEDSFAGTWYEVFLKSVDGEWYAVGVNSNDFAERFKAESFDLEAELNNTLMAMDRSVFLSETVEIENGMELTTSISTSRNYNPNYARAYAYTYSSETSGTQYNPNFSNFTGSGGDCMNFASQCVWAGLWGSNESAAINNRLIPMDKTGSNLWYSSKTAGHTPSWTSCSDFRTLYTEYAGFI